MMRHCARKMRELVPPPWRHRIRGRWRVGSVGEMPSAGGIGCGIRSRLSEAFDERLNAVVLVVVMVTKSKEGPKKRKSAFEDRRSSS